MAKEKCRDNSTAAQKRRKQCRGEDAEHRCFSDRTYQCTASS